MFMHNRHLMYTVRVGAPDPRTANLILEQDAALEQAMLMRTMSDPDSDPTTGAELGETTTATRPRD